MNDTAVKPFKVGDWLIEPELLRISKNGEVRKVEFMTMEILRCFVSKQGEVVSKQQLLDEVWGEVYVTDNALTRAVSRLRKVFDDDPHNPSYIDTISKSGYRLIAPVELIGLNGKKTVADIQSKTQTRNHILLWALLGVIIIGGGVGLITMFWGDKYSGFYDPVPISTLVGPERGHTISPDGKKFSFSYMEPGTNYSNVYVKLLEDLSQVKFTNLDSHQGYGVWSPDGNFMVYASTEEANCGIYKEPSFGGEKTRIGDCFQAPRGFVWSPDGKTIAFSDYKSPEESRRIFFLDLETQVSEEILNLEIGMVDRNPAFSPDGEYLIFRRVIDGRGDIYKMRISDKTLTRLTFDNSRILGLDVFDDGRQIAFASDRGGTWGLWKFPFEGGAATRFQINDRVPVEPKFSADGERMIYKSIRDQTWIWAVEKEGENYNNPTQVASSTRAEIHPSLSKDGNKVVFVSNRSGYFEIWTNNFENNNPAKLTSLNGSFVNMPSWSPDGTEVVFDARIDDDNSIYVLDVATKMMRTFTSLKGDQVNAHYSEDGEHIYFASNHTGSWEIWKKPVDEGEGMTQITLNGGYYLQEGPDDDYLYFSRADASGIWRIKDEVGAQEELFIESLNDFDWGNWVATRDGIIYIDRSFGIQIFQQPYDMEEPPVSLFTPAKRIQSWNSSITATFDGNKIIFTQIENSEDEIMMVDFK